jgi:hypothetical protein
MTDPSHQPRRDRMYEERVSDPYRTRAKWPEPTTCPVCHAHYRHGRWQWGETAPDAATHLCPACERVRDGVPAAQVSLAGPFFDAHRDEILHLVRNREATERAEHPLERIMEVAETPEGTVVTFTGVHLAHGVGEALRDAYQGELESRYTDEENLLRIVWTR